MFQPSAQELFFSKKDPQDPRVGETFKQLNWEKLEEELAEPSWVILGWPDDEGVKNNGGRLGAALAPPRIRKHLYKMTCFDRPQIRLLDGGDLKIDQLSLGARHQEARESALEVLTQKGRVASLGGGHDYGFADAAAFATWCASQKQKPLVINFDAHLDVRPLDRGITSGTPFFRLLEEFPQTDFLEVGLQQQCNSRSHDEWLVDHGGRRIYVEDWESQGLSLSGVIFNSIQDWLLRPRPVFLSVDIDVFSSAFAPGCSQSWPGGITPRDFFPCLDLLKSRLDLKALGIYEVSPPLDIDDHTSKLAAQILHRVFF